MPRLLFICRERLSAYGNSIGLLNSAQFLVNYLVDRYGYEAKAVSVIDSNAIDKEVYHYKPTHVIIHALWVPTYKLKELTSKYKNIQWVVRIHSKIPFLANEGIAIEWLKEYNNLHIPNLTISANSEEATKGLNAVGIATNFLPNIYQPAYQPERDTRYDFMPTLNVGCFGAIRPLKNHLIQAMAAIAYANKRNIDMKFYINASRTEQKGEQVLKNIKALFINSRHQLVEIPWQDHQSFLKTVSIMDIGMQVSLTETFNIVTADFVYCGIPVIVSSDIEWMPCYTKANPHSIEHIVDVLDFNLTYKKPIKWINKGFLYYSNTIAGSIWSNYLSQ